MSTLLDWQTELDALVEERFDDLVQVRRHLHQHPEPSGQEVETSRFLQAYLRDRGLTPQLGPDGRGLIVDGGSGDASRVGLRADIDALLIQDQKQIEYRSTRSGVMHACGHDAHAAIVVGAVEALHLLQQRGQLPWNVAWRGVFQPSEETATGAEEMIAAGAIAGIDAIFATHVDTTLAVGSIGLRSGALTANCDMMRFSLRGRGGHAARPHESIDPIVAAANLIHAIYLFVPRATDSQDAVVATIGQVVGGDNPNVIPDHIELRGTLRTLDHRVREATMEHIRQLARGVAEASGTMIDVDFDVGVNSVVNDSALTDMVQEAAIQQLGSAGVYTIPRPSMGSEDFAQYLAHCPGVMFRVGCRSDDVGLFGLHTPHFDIDERAIAVGAKLLARSAILWSKGP